MIRVSVSATNGRRCKLLIVAYVRLVIQKLCYFVLTGCADAILRVGGVYYLCSAISNNQDLLLIYTRGDWIYSKNVFPTLCGFVLLSIICCTV